MRFRPGRDRSPRSTGSSRDPRERWSPTWQTPYDLSALGYQPVAIETAAGKQEYVTAQRQLAERGVPLRQRLLDECDRLLARELPAARA